MFAYKLHPAGTDSVSAVNCQSAGTQGNLLSVPFFLVLLVLRKRAADKFYI